MLFTLVLLQATNPLDVEGIWWTRGGNAQVEVVREDGSIRGDVIWTDSADALAADGVVDAQALPSGDRLGKTLFEGHEADGDRWKDGTIHDFDGGNSYRSNIWLSGPDTLSVEGCLGLFCRTQEWSRVQPAEVNRLELRPVELSANRREP